jgi:DNA helicase-2/ATP-dependent DNA helicase PcrA
MSNQPNKYQQAVYDHIRNGQGNLIVEARAGSGKTSTIVQALQFLPKSRNVLFVAFNRHIAEELSARAPINVEVSTLNSFGFRCMRNAGMQSKIKDNKVKNIVWYKIYREQNFGQYVRIVGAVLKTISLCKAHCIVKPNEKDIDWITTRYVITYPSELKSTFINVVQQTMEESLRQTQIIDFDDQLLYPICKSLPIPQYDYVFVDEAQDLNPVQIELIKRACRGMCVAVGDTHQAIYGFRGADPDAIANIQLAFQSTVLPLSICYRCSKNVIIEAQKIVPDIEYADNAQAGTVTTLSVDEYRDKIDDGDWVLCRTTAPLVHEALRMIRNRRRAMVKGRQIGEAILFLAERVLLDDERGVDALDAYEMEQCEKLRGNELALLEMQDQVATIRALVEAYGLDGLKQGIADLFGDNTIDGVMYCTVHRSKGLETNNVYLICPELMPHPKATEEWQKVQERNLQYIAITRAKQNFYYVEGKIK